MKLACNYAVVRFLPYAATEEFVNVGVVLHCAATGYLDFRLARKWSRVTEFFPELDTALYRNALQMFRVDLGSVKAATGTNHPQQLVMEDTIGGSDTIFRELVRPRESLFRFSGVRTVLTEDPNAKLYELYSFYVERQFAREREYQETLMTYHLRKLFMRTGTAAYYRSESVGNEKYSVTIPFVHRRDHVALKAIKPLDLNKETSTKIYEHGDQWINRVRRLREIDMLPRRLLFAVREPETPGTRADAAHEIEVELARLETKVLPIRNEAEVIEFAKVA
jgi:hypothetical protein